MKKKKKNNPKVKHLRDYLSHPEVNENHLNVLYQMSQVPGIQYFYELVRLKKLSMMQEEFSYSELDPVKNAMNKARYKGMDEALTFLVQSIKRSADILEEVTETDESNS